MIHRQALLTLRQQSQGLSGSDFKSPAEVLRWMGAIQAQHFSMAKWAIGTRLPGSSISQIETALNHGYILRTHVLRPTWHLVRAEDLLWMLKLTAPNLRRQLNSSCKSLAITSKALIKTEKIFQKLLQQEDTDCLKRDDLLAGLRAHKIVTDAECGSLFLMHAELNGLLCSGPDNGQQNTYALVEKRLGTSFKKVLSYANGISKEEALVKLARLYYQSRGPASLADFKWWSGLSLTDARTALSGVLTELELIKGEEPLYFLRFAPKIPKAIQLYQLLPSFDEYLISYRDRTAAVDLAHHPFTFTKNGIFKPVLLFSGRAVGTWDKKEVENNASLTNSKALSITVQLFEGVERTLPDDVFTAVKAYNHFWGGVTPLDSSNLIIKAF